MVPISIKDEEFKRMVLGWIKETLSEMPSNDSIIELMEEDLIIEPVTELTITEKLSSYKMAVFKCEKCLFQGILKRELLEGSCYMFCPRCDNTLFDERLK